MIGMLIERLTNKPVSQPVTTGIGVIDVLLTQKLVLRKYDATHSHNVPFILH